MFGDCAVLREAKQGDKDRATVIINLSQRAKACPICMTRAVTNATIGLGRRISLASFPVNVTSITAGPVLPRRRR